MKPIATKTVVRVEELPDDRLLLHCLDGTNVEIEASGEQRRQWLEETPAGAVFDLVRSST